MAYKKKSEYQKDLKRNAVAKEKAQKIEQELKEEEEIKLYGEPLAPANSHYGQWQRSGEIEKCFLIVRDGARRKKTKAQIAKDLNLSADTFEGMLKKYPRLREQYDKGKYYFCASAVDRLVSLADGITIEKEVAFFDIKNSKIVKTTVKEQKPPCHKSIKLILEQMRAEEWNKGAVPSDQGVENSEKVQTTLQTLAKAIANSEEVAENPQSEDEDTEYEGTFE